MATFHSIIDQFRQARRVSVPILAINTPDPASTIQTLVSSTLPPSTSTDSAHGQPLTPECPFPLLKWDLTHGLLGLNQAGQELQSRHIDPSEQQLTCDPVEALRILERLSERVIVFFQGAHRMLNHDAVIQGIWNLRDIYKSSGGTLVLLGVNITVPADLSHDVLALTEPLPTRDTLHTIYLGQHAAARLPPPSEEETGRALDALQGLATFAAEQVIALAMRPTGVDVPQLWVRKKSLIDSTPGLRIWNGLETFDKIGGLEGIKSCARRILHSKQRPRAIVFIDEIEKVLSGAGSEGLVQSDLSRQMLGTLLSYMEDHQAGGLLLTGIAGTSKTMFGKAIGAEAGAPTIQFNINEVKGSLVGETERQLRQALDIISSVSQDQVLFVATSNSIASLPPELIRRFTFGTWFFDLPTEQEKRLIWRLYRQQYKLDMGDTQPDDRQWTGAEIFRCATLSWNFGIPLKDAAQYIIPLAVSAKDVLKRQREQARDSYLSASTGHVYRITHEVPTTRTRAFSSLN